MYEYIYITKTDIDSNELNHLLSKKNTLLIFRLKNDFISQLTIEKLLEEIEDENDLQILDIQLDYHTKVIGEFYLERLPKFYFYSKGKMIHSYLGNISKMKLGDFISTLLVPLES